MKRIAARTIIILLVALAWLPMPPATAAPLRSPDWTHTFDFTAARNQFSLVAVLSGTRGVYIPGTGWHSSYFQPIAGVDVQAVDILTNFPPTTITSIDLHYDFTKGASNDSGAPLGVNIIGFAGTLQSGDTQGSNLTMSYSGTDAGETQIELFIRAGFTSGGLGVDPGGIGLIDSLVVSGDGIDPFGLYRPVTSGDEINYSDNDPIPHESDIWLAAGANVYAGFRSTVTNLAFNGQWQVTLTDDAGNQAIYKNLAQTFVSTDLAIRAGCILGIASASTADVISETTGLTTQASTINFTQYTNFTVPWRTWPDSLDRTPCNAITDSVCLDLNRDIDDNHASWAYGNGTQPYSTPTDNGFDIPRGGNIYQDIFDKIDNSTTYYVTVQAAPQAGTNGELTVRLGDAVSVIPVSATIAGEFMTVTSAAITPSTPTDAGPPENYQLRLNNSYSQPGNLRVSSVCIHVGDAVTAPGACFFANSDMHVDDWSSSGGATYTPANPSVVGSPSFYSLPSGAKLFDPVDISAFSDVATDYTLSVYAGPVDLLGAGSIHASIRDSITDDLLQEVDTWNLTPVVMTNSDHPFSLTAATHLDGSLVLENTSGDAIKISRVCLSVKGGIFPGYAGAVITPVFTQDCTTCGAPAAIADITDVASDLQWIVAWLAFGFCYLGFILRCIVLGALNSIISWVQSAIAGIALFGLWLGRVVGDFGNWAGRTIGVLFGNLMGGLLVIANAIFAWLFSLPFVTSALDSLSLIGAWLAAVFAVIMSAIALFLTAVKLIGAMFSLIGAIWTAFFNALSGTSSITFPFPDCTDSGSALYDACLPIDIVNFLFSQVPMLAIVVNALAFSVFWAQGKKLWRRTVEALTA